MARDTAVQYNSAGSGTDMSAKAEPSASITTEDTDDNISATSTPYDSEDPDAEYNVEAILAQDDNMDGVTKYLVQWSGYPLEKCTWEPQENMGEELLQDLWEEKKKRSDYAPFDLGLYYGALAAKDERHRRRNIKRKRLGLPETFPFFEDDEALFVNESVADTEAAKDTADASPATISAPEAVADPVPVATRSASASTTEPTGIESDGSGPMDLTHDSDDDIVVLDDISAPAAPKSKKKKKKQKKEVSGLKEKTGLLPKQLAKQKLNAEAGGPSQPKRRVSAPLPTTETLPEKTKKLEKPEKRKSTDGEKRAATSGVAKNAKAGPEAARRLSEQRPVGQPLQKTNASATGNTKEPGRTKLTAETTKAKPAAFSARKSATAPQETGNAFNSGIKPRTRMNLLAASSDPSKPQQLFTKRSILRKVEMQGREKEDAMIEPSRLSRLFPISQRPSDTPAPLAMTVTRKNDGNFLATQTANTEVEDASASQPKQDQPRSILSIRRSPETVPRRTKSVHFSVTDDDDELSNNHTRRTFSDPSPRGTTSIDDDAMAIDFEPHKTSISMPDRAMKLLTGSQKDPLEAIFSVVAEPEYTKDLLEEVFANSFLRFDHSCLADTLLQQIGGLRERNLFSGYIKPDPHIKSSHESLEAIFNRLLARHSGLFILKPTFAILLYPSRSQDWSEERFGFPAPESEQVAARLRYVVFKTFFDGSGFIRPSSRFARNFSIPANIDRREHLMKVFTGLERASFARLFPRHTGAGPANGPAKNHIFLAFPPSLVSSMQQIAYWVRAMDTDCAIYDSTVPGAWMAFRDKITLNQLNGAVVVHELAISAIRRFPDLHRFLDKKSNSCKFWAMSQSILSPPVFSQIEEHDLDDTGSCEKIMEPAAFGKINCRQLFPQGLAIFVTPSFIISEPGHTYDLFRWISYVHRMGDILLTVVTAWDICKFLRDLADEKYEKLRQRPPSRSATAATRRRDDDPDMECRFRYETCLLAEELCGSLETIYFRPTAFADEAIDGHDEQSLVNWFGWWSSMHIDQYRMFYVVGTDEALRYKNNELAARVIRIPGFRPETVADPDVARERVRDVNDPALRTSTPGNSSQPTVPDTGPSLPHQNSRSQRFPDGNPSPLVSYLMRSSSKDDFWKVYGYPVMWRDPDEAFEFGSLSADKFTLNHWLTFSWKFSNFFRTYIGLFYLVDDSYDRQHIGHNDQPPRHPFIVIYRPVNPHISRPSYKATELIFWDFRAKNRLRGQDLVSEATALTKGQRAVLDFVREAGHKKHDGAALTRVYIGGEAFTPWEDRNSNTRTTPSNELDATAEYLDHMQQNMRDLLPPSPKYLEARGFKEVVVRGDKRENQATKSQKGGETIATEGGEGKADAKIVFHAPRGEHARHVGNSHCRNQFYDCARQARKQNSQAATMQFEFCPTTKWYREQAEEGRGFSHVHVVGWKSFFDTYRVDDYE